MPASRPPPGGALHKVAKSNRPHITCEFPKRRLVKNSIGACGQLSGSHFIYFRANLQYSISYPWEFRIRSEIWSAAAYNQMNCQSA